MRLERIGLPGMGVSHVLTTSDGRQLGIVSFLDGSREIVVYDPDDVERAAGTVVLRRDEAVTVADVLRGEVTMDHVAELTRPLGGVQAVRIRMPAATPYVDRPLGDTRARTLTGASIVAVLRDDEVIASPGPDFVFRADDVVVAVGGADAVAKLRDLLVDAC